ncbi:LuxR C-terminal-related transcriptional regulator [Serratia ureilytica]|uniref:helix-turn-helix domain-containing protein n=1 Tax=Serratia ureilytica TaxID=300181 RepID=UPI00249A73DE|nr:LuxR C-terminal-related transcriptional regulator [Serratia ureilytica]MDI3197824.1 LuxR C-terminal-related transcriptional regulator [Serratia ureilytica]
MKITQSYTILLRGNEIPLRIEWVFIHRHCIRIDPYFIIGLHALIEHIFHHNNKKGEGGALHRLSLVKSPASYTDWIRISLPQRCSLMATQAALSKTISLCFRQGISPGKAKIPSPIYFTQQERRVAQYLREGFSQTHTGLLLGLSVKTVNAHKQSLMRKLGFRNNREFQYWLLAGSGECREVVI